MTKEYPARKKFKTIASFNDNIDILKNKIYIGHEYMKHLNKYICCFACCANKNLPYLVGNIINELID